MSYSQKHTIKEPFLVFLFPDLLLSCGDQKKKNIFFRLEEIKALGLELITLERQNALVAEFPIKNTLSYMLGGPMKVYPAFEKEMKSYNKVPQISYEIYDIPAKKIIFVMGLP